MVACAQCGAEQGERARFCADCGAPLATVCASCGEPSPPGKRFCAQCGAPLTESAAAAPAPATPSREPVAERRVCSVLFCDLVGFTPFAEARDPEEVREVLSRYFDVARRVVQRYGGLVEKFIGDAVMAVWGTPVADEEDTERAVRAALELVDAVALLGEEVGATGLRARAGVVTGEVAVTLGAEGQGMVAGDAVNTASRVQAAAEAGTVLCDEQTRRLSADAIAFEDAGAVELKGKAVAEQLFRAVRVLSGMGGKQRSDGLEAPFTGRDVELRTLKDLFHASAERRTPRLVVISGPAGVGKTRLGFEFYKYIDGIADTVLWHRGRCLSYGDGVAFWALAEIVRQRFGIAEEDPVSVAEGKLAEGMVRFVEQAQERDYIGARLSRLLGVPYRAEAGAVLAQDELFAGWRLFFERLAQVAPVLLLVEDAQYADESLLGFFDHLIDWTRDLAIFVVLFARPGHPAIDAGYGVGRNRSTLSLDAFDDASMGSLVDALVPGMPSAAREAIVARAQGIPLFAVETVRSLIDKGVVQREGEAYRLVGDLGSLSVPESLHALLASRLDALPPAVRTLVADASVIGTSFPKEALVAVSGADAGAVDDALAELVRRDVLQVYADPLSPERGAYRFSQEMLRQVAYETLSKRDRKGRHLATAAHLRAVFANDGEEIADVIARHYLDALEAGPGDPDAAAVGEDALSFLVRAAERAEASGAPRRAVEGFTEAAAIARGPQAAALAERAARAAVNAGSIDEALEQTSAALARYEELGDTRAVARVRSLHGRVLQIAGRYGAAREVLARALEVLRPEPDRDTVEALNNLTALEVFSGRRDEARAAATECLELAQALGVDDGLFATVLITCGLAAALIDHLVEATALLREAARFAHRAQQAGLVARALLNLADVLAGYDPQEALSVAREAVAAGRRTGDRVLSTAYANLAAEHLDAGEWDEAERTLSEALGMSVGTAALLYYMQGVLAGLRGDEAGVRSALDAVPDLRASDEVQAQAVVGLLESLAAACAGDRAAALTHARGVLEKADALGMGAESQRWAWAFALHLSRGLRDRASLEWLLGLLDARPSGHLPILLRAHRELARALIGAEEGAPDAVSRVERAVEALRAVGNPYELAQGLCDYAEALVASGAAPTVAAAATAEAREIAERLRCPPLLERAAAVTPATAPVTGGA